MSEHKLKDGYRIIQCPICKSKTFEYISWSEYGWGVVEQYGNCSRCGFAVAQAYSPVMEDFEDIKRGFKNHKGEYIPKNVKRHKRIRRKLNIKGYDINPPWLRFV